MSNVTQFPPKGPEKPINYVTRFTIAGKGMVIGAGPQAFPIDLGIAVGPCFLLRDNVAYFKVPEAAQ